MIYAMFVMIALVSAAAICSLGARFGVLDFGEKLKLYVPCDDENVVPFRGQALIWIITACFLSALALQVALYNNAAMITHIKLYGLYVIVLSAALVDSKRRIIPNVLILVGVAFRVLLYGAELLMQEDLETIFVNDMLGLLLGFGFLALVSILSKGAMGFGDAKLFGVIGLLSGSFCTYSTLFLSLIISTVFGLAGLVLKKMGRKSAFPFGPFIAAGYLIAVLLTSY